MAQCIPIANLTLARRLKQMLTHLTPLRFVFQALIFFRLFKFPFEGSKALLIEY